MPADTHILAIDPGSEKSGLIRYDSMTHRVDVVGILPNMEAVVRVPQLGSSDHVLVLEDTKAYTLPRGKSGAGRFFPEQVRIATFWAGRFVEAWGGPYALIDRRRVKQLLCGTTTVGDPEVWEAVMDRFGGSRERAVGTKKQPGPLYGVTRDLRSAVALALAYEIELSIPHSVNCTRETDS